MKDHEVVLTFDDGPLPPYTESILHTLASQCGKATYFLVGQMARDFEAVKNHLLPGDKAIYIPRDSDPLEMKLSIRWNIEDIEAMAVKETVEFPIAPMILAVKKPDYLGDSKWELRHGSEILLARLNFEVIR